MRKTCLRTLIAALLIASTLSATACAETALVTGSEVNVRSGPGADFAILGSYSRGDTVEVLDRGSGSWYAVDYDGTIGYMSADFVALQTDGSAVILTDTPLVQAQTPSVPQTPGPESGGIVVTPGLPGASAGTNGQITGMYVRFRSGPSSTSSILGEFNEGKAVTILGTEGEWTLCLIDGEYGYIASRYVSYSAAPALTPAPTESIIITPAPFSTPVLVTPAPGVSTPGIVIGQGGAAVQQPGYGQSVIIGYPPASPVPTAVPGTGLILVTPTPAPAAGSSTASDKAGTITGDYVRFRRGPGSDYSIIRTYDHGTAVSILGTEGDWVYCSIDGANGYVYGQYIQTAPTQTSAPAVTPAIGQTVADAAVSAPSVPANIAGTPGYIKGNNVRFRSAPDLSAEIIGELYYGNDVTITGTDGTWTALICDGTPGFVFSQYVASGKLQPTGGTNTASSASGREVADYALQYVGTPYHWGGVDPSTGFDCSGFAYYVYKHFGYTLNRVASEQALNGRHAENADLQPGDLICFYSGGSYIGHVGIYVGNNLFVHAATSSTGVITSELTGYYARRGFEVRRIVG